eukprot:CAMPEP_0170616288 /NCGR_PEP_ID=MMETSP0224-20130122/25791_1 /TAXON_ID=285029 /ORGANISM="Togula jolla, Strain CCCM 725" /LENGTH=86 /DNA_ID=CAMNT_0010942077 /DNA_START=190 /DNA_END=450 /DNA_ORIENTATION=+
MAAKISSGQPVTALNNERSVKTKKASQKDMNPAIRIVSAHRIEGQQQAKNEILGSSQQLHSPDAHLPSWSSASPESASGGCCLECL